METLTLLVSRLGACAVVLASIVGASADDSVAKEAGISTYVDCPQERIGTQLVRCDVLTGTGADAPFWIPEQR
ncbi:hypothetical protein ACIPY2_04965 [Paenarthrobacter sp. NPDC089675]|uniref:hypothetical protein n=1 Tax=Paenarthrobacter sp. NPDC089675 TaxID=3364376 RepID=UPI003827507E